MTLKITTPAEEAARVKFIDLTDREIVNELAARHPELIVISISPGFQCLQLQGNRFTLWGWLATALNINQKEIERSIKTGPTKPE